MLLVMVVVLGLAAGMTGQTWRAAMQRAREAELIWRGQQYRRAIESFYTNRGNKTGPKMFPAKLDDLVRDPRYPGVVRHLRKLYSDPMTGEDWELVKDPAERIIGVRSSSDLEPFQQDGFPKELEDFKGKTAYKEWEFVYKPPRKTPQRGTPRVPQPPGARTPNP